MNFKILFLSLILLRLPLQASSPLSQIAKIRREIIAYEQQKENYSYDYRLNFALIRLVGRHSNRISDYEARIRLAKLGFDDCTAILMRLRAQLALLEQQIN